MTESNNNKSVIFQQVYLALHHTLSLDYNVSETNITIGSSLVFAYKYIYIYNIYILYGHIVVIILTVF